ncbi:MAG: RNA polymerase sigma-70 factor [Prevotella sp.]|nr:RNA polymerase sigma-70 factor [Prevotella sp.]MBR1462238.1 RNA polymerase sigma-70 factor [Prevotella sp.]
MERALAKHDRKAFHQLYLKYYQALVVYSMSITTSQQVAEDVVQDVFSSLWDNEQEFDHPSVLKSYLYNSVRNRSVDHLRHRQVEEQYINKVHEEHPSFTVDIHGSEDFFTEDVYRQLFEYINQFPPRQREIFQLSLQGKSNAEIAELMGIGIETVKTQKRRGKESLRERMSLESFALLLYLIG